MFLLKAELFTHAHHAVWKNPLHSSKEHSHIFQEDEFTFLHYCDSVAIRLTLMSPCSMEKVPNFHILTHDAIHKSVFIYLFSFQIYYLQQIITHS